VLRLVDESHFDCSDRSYDGKLWLVALRFQPCQLSQYVPLSSILVKLPGLIPIPIRNCIILFGVLFRDLDRPALGSPTGSGRCHEVNRGLDLSTRSTAALVVVEIVQPRLHRLYSDGPFRFTPL
jgi:hypothetical protein